MDVLLAMPLLGFIGFLPGMPLRMRFASSQVSFTALAQTYFRQGRQTLQINVVSRKKLRKDSNGSVIKH